MSGFEGGYNKDPGIAAAETKKYLSFLHVVSEVLLETRSLNGLPESRIDTDLYQSYVEMTLEDLIDVFRLLKPRKDRYQEISALHRAMQTKVDNLIGEEE